MDDIITFLIKSIDNGGSAGVISILLLIVGYCIWDKRNMSKSLEAKDEKIDKIINDYYKITMQVSETIKSLKQVLLEIRSKL